MVSPTMTNFPAGVAIWGPPYGGTDGVPLLPSGPISYFGKNVWFVDTVNGSDGYSGTSPSQAFKTMGRAFWVDNTAPGSSTPGDGARTDVNVNRNDTIYFVGTVREQLTAPLLGRDGTALTGVQIIGMANGGVRDDDGAKWTYPASGAVAGGALLSLRQQGWVVANFLMTPEPNGSGGTCILLNRQENATFPDSSHFVALNMRFVGIDVTTTYGIQDIGGCSNVQVQNCEFYLCTTGLYCSSTAIAVPLRWKVYGNRFLQNTNDIVVPSSYCVYQGNTHMSDNTSTYNLTSGGNNTVKFNSFPNVAADIDPANGYDGNATDTWTSNSAQDAVVFGDPA